MSERKTFFESLEPKSALLVGLLSGFMTLCTVGFFVLGFMMIKGGSIAMPTGAKTGEIVAVNNPPSAGGSDIVAPPPVVSKSDRPKVELFVMSHCPYGLQMQKAYVPAWELLKDKADIDVKFVSYLMHGQKEKDDNNIEYCIQKDQKDKYIPFLKCFTATGDSKACMGSTGVDQNKVNSCIGAADKQFAISEEFNNQSKWLSGRYPMYNVHKDLNDKYGVQGSPTLVINGSVVEVGRSPEAVKQAICAAFNNAPKECGQTLSNASASPGFGTQVGGAAPSNAAGCAGA